MYDFVLFKMSLKPTSSCCIVPPISSIYLTIPLSRPGHCPPSELAYRTRVLGQFLAWLLDGYVLGLVRACFYVTESMGHKNALRFYRQEVWARLQELAFR